MRFVGQLEPGTGTGAGSGGIWGGLFLVLGSMKNRAYECAEVTAPFIEHTHYPNVVFDTSVGEVVGAFRKSFPQARRLTPRFDDGAAALTMHRPDYVAFVLEGTRLDPGFNPFPLYFIAREGTVFTEPASFEARHTLFFFDEVTRATPEACVGAVLGAAASLQAAEWVLDGAGPRLALACCRPPGHHAHFALGGGLCLFANPAIAARALKRRGRVAVVDVDQDHGNGTQALFYEDPEVLTVSLHAAGWPFVAGHPEEVGKGAGVGRNLNLAMPRGSGSAVYLEALERALAEVKLFRPASLVVALGFDAQKEQGFGFLQLESEDFAIVGRRLGELGLPTVITTEGCYGYYSSTAVSADHFFAAWEQSYRSS